MRSYKMLLLSGAAALASSAALAAEFNGKDIPLHASAVAGFHRVAPDTQRSRASDSKIAKCGTGFGAELPSPDGLISWNDTTESGYNVGGAADFTCSAKTKVKQVWVTGYMSSCGRTCPEPFNVTFYRNDPADGSDEANDIEVVCTYTGLIGTTGGGVEGMVLTQLKLPTPCKFKAGKKYWVEVQNNDTAAAWYWEYSSTLQGMQADWADRNNKFGDGCTAFDNNEYLSNCLDDYAYPDYMLELH